MSKPKVWTLPELLDRIWMLSRGKRTAVYSGEARPVKLGNGMLDAQLPTKRVVTGWDEDYKPRTYELNKISAASAAGLYERIKTMRAKGPEAPSAAERATGYREPLASQIQAWNDGYVKGLATYQTVNSPAQIYQVPASAADAYERQLQDWAKEVQRRGGI